MLAYKDRVVLIFLRFLLNNIPQIYNFLSIMVFHQKREKVITYFFHLIKGRLVSPPGRFIAFSRKIISLSSVFSRQLFSKNRSRIFSLEQSNDIFYWLLWGFIRYFYFLVRFGFACRLKKAGQFGGLGCLLSLLLSALFAGSSHLLAFVHHTKVSFSVKIKIHSWTIFAQVYLFKYKKLKSN